MNGMNDRCGLWTVSQAGLCRQQYPTGPRSLSSGNRGAAPYDDHTPIESRLPWH
ncbi:MAG: hypothetical protein KatS3mg114_0672 [Planctomycetaceae bacterium]|nr:MAG: hypothetical protein KatS3mg114_0672 [Planctomycetaceae bacterium]